MGGGVVVVLGEDIEGKEEEGEVKVVEVGCWGIWV